MVCGAEPVVRETLMSSMSHTGLRAGAVAVLPLILLVVFGAIYWYERSKGGYKPDNIRSGAHAD